MDISTERIKSKFGNIVILNSDSNNMPSSFCIIFPGYTGDATTHTKFINTAIKENISAVCVNVAVSKSINEMEIATNKLFEELIKAKPKIINRLHFIKSNSFGAYLSTLWMQKLPDIKKTALITPCSPEQLEKASLKLGIEGIKNDSQNNSKINHKAPVLDSRIYLLDKDEVVEEPSQEFLKQFVNAETIYISSDENTNHFNVTDHNELTHKLIDWFKYEEK